MVILAVDNNATRLEQLVGNLWDIFPNDIIKSTCDPLMAGKYSFDNTVDVVFAAMTMKPQDGIALGVFVRRKNPHAKLYLIAEQDEFKDAAFEEGNPIDGKIVNAATKDVLREIAVDISAQLA